MKLFCGNDLEWAVHTSISVRVRKLRSLTLPIIPPALSEMNFISCGFTAKTTPALPSASLATQRRAALLVQNLSQGKKKKKGK